MADRTVKVVLKADVSAYVRDVEAATAATVALRRAAERFEDRYTATLRVNTVGAVRDVKQAERQIDRAAAGMSRSLDRAGRKIQSTLADVKRNIADLNANGADNLLQIDTDQLNRDIAVTRAKLADLSQQRVTFETAAATAEARAELAKLVGQLRKLDRTNYEAHVRLQVDQLEQGLLKLRRQLADSGPGSLAAQIRSSLSSAFQSLPELEITADSTDAERKISTIRGLLARLNEKRIGVDVDADSALAEIAKIRAAMGALARTTSDVRVRVDLEDAERALAGLEKRAQRSQGAFVDGLRRQIEGAFSALPDLDQTFTLAEEKIKRLRRELVELSTMQVGRDILAPEFERRVASLRDRLDSLGKSTGVTRLRYDLEKASEALRDMNKVEPPDLGTFGERARRQLDAAFSSLPELTIDADATPAEREIAKIKAELATLRDKRIGVDIDSKTFMSEAAALQARLAQIARTTTSARFQVDAGQAAGELEKLAGAASHADREIKKTNRSAGLLEHGLFRVARDASNTAQALYSLAIPPALIASIPAVASLGASLEQAAGAAALLPAVGFAAGTGLAAIAVGLKDWKEVAKQLGKGKLDKARKAAEELGPAAKETALQLIAMADAYDTAAEAVQAELFKGTKDDLKLLGNVYFPIIRDNLSGIATQLNIAAHAFVAFSTSARTTQDAKHGLDLIAKAAEPLAGTIVNLSAIMRDMGVAGAEELPGLANGFEDVTKRLADYISLARSRGDINRWIRTGIEEISQFGRVLRNAGSILDSVFDAASLSGLDFLGTLERLTGSAARFLESPRGQSSLISFLSELRDIGASLVPGLRAVGDVLGHVFDNASRTAVLENAGKALSDLAVAAAPVVKVLSDLTSLVLTPFLKLVQGIAPALGPAIAGIIAFRTAAKTISRVQVALVGGTTAAGAATTGLAGRFDRAAQAATGNAAATSKVTGALNKVSKSLPFVGAALVGIGLAYDALRSRADDAATSVISGSQSLNAAYQQTYESLIRQKSVLDPAATSTLLFGSAQEKAALFSGLASQAIRDTNRSIEEQIAKLPPLQQAQARVTLAQDGLNQAVNRYSLLSPQADAATRNLANANVQLQIQQIATTQGVDLQTAALIRNRDVMLTAMDAAAGYYASVDAATAAVATNGRTLDIHTQQGRANQQALNDLARAARADMDATIAQTGATAESIQKGREHQDQLFKTALQMGMSRQEAYNYVGQLNLVPASQETRFFTPGLREAIGEVNELSRLLGAMTATAAARENYGNLIRSAKSAVSRVSGRATGGPISGPGSGTSDDVLMWGSNGEYVQRAAVVRDQGMARMDLLNSGRGEIVPKGALPGYAGGGLLGPVPASARPREYDTVTLDFRGALDEARKWKNEWFPPYNPSAGVEQWRGLVLAALARHGQPAFLADRVLMQIGTESGGNPNAINLWDSNARAGHPSQGLLQTIPSTFAAYHEPGTSWNITDPWANINASMNYALARYGSLQAAYQGHGYRDGGTIPGTGRRDDKIVMAQSGERVLTRGQNVMFERLVSGLDRPLPIPAALRGLTRGGDGASTSVAIHNENHFTEAVDLDLFNSRQDFAVRSLSA